MIGPGLMYRSRISFSHTHWLMTDRWEPESSPGVGGSARVSPWRRQEAAGRKHNQAFRSRQRSPWHRHGNRLDRPRPRRCHVSWWVTWRTFSHSQAAVTSLYHCVLLKTLSKKYYDIIIFSILVSSPLQRARLPFLQQQVQELKAAPAEQKKTYK